jgi:hypothetical protein
MDFGAGQNLPPTRFTPECTFGVDPIAARTLEQTQFRANGPRDFERVKTRVTKLVLAIHSHDATDDDVEELDYLTRESPAVAEFVHRLLHQQIALEVLMLEDLSAKRQARPK